MIFNFECLCRAKTEKICLTFSCFIESNRVKITNKKKDGLILCTVPKHENLNCSRRAIMFIRPVDISEMSPIRDKEKCFISNSTLQGMMFFTAKDMQAKNIRLPTGIDPFFDLRESIQTMFVFPFSHPRVSTLYFLTV